MLNKFILSLIIGSLCGLFGTLGGAEKGHQAFRGILIPIFLVIIAFLALKNPYICVIGALYGVFTIGYGIPDETDAGSPVGAFFWKIFKGNNLLTNVATRGFIGKLASLSLIIIPILKHNWILFGFVSALIINTYAWLSWRELRSFKIFDIWLSESEFWTYFSIGLGASLLIYF